ncbi:hypothetical protein AB9F35_35150, partial [Rhizobium leguminosarum]|uniref:hypothetical protein n=1 Tax=Rhizobium leguminosarum TaxID=384 RepID=UPI003F9AFBCC
RFFARSAKPVIKFAIAGCCDSLNAASSASSDSERVAVRAGGGGQWTGWSSSGWRLRGATKWGL